MCRQIETLCAKPEARDIMRLNVTVFTGTLLCFLLGQSGVTQQRSIATAGADWPLYRHDSAGTGYSTLAQINTRNVANLSQAWTFSLQSVPAVPTLNSEVTPIVVSGVMYVPAANRSGARIGDGEGNVELPADRGRAFAARRRVLAGAGNRFSTNLLHVGTAADRSQCQNG